MRLFTCQNCDQLLYFENRACQRCGFVLGYLPEAATLSALQGANHEGRQGAEGWGEVWRPLAAPGRLHRFCANAAFDACNWLVAADADSPFCAACRHNRTIPDMGNAENLRLWQDLERAKHRLFYTLLRLRLPLANRQDDPTHGLVFDFLEDPATPDGPKVLTGHDDGVITLALKEADDALREKLRTEMGEPYRTLLGHFRHEIGHYFWDVLVRDGGHIAACRAVFGDDRQDYADALAAHYRAGAPPDWQQYFISAYASAHPWEDFAETWAHYLHIVDTLETAGAFGLRIRPQVSRDPDLQANVDFDPHADLPLAQLIDAWLPLSFAVNSLNRSMGQPDFYPFVLSPAVMEKLGFIHQLVHHRLG